MKICLNMIVKNEEHVIERCLENHLGLVDAVAIVDTGSTDRTIDLAHAFMRKHNLPGEIIVRRWRQFGPSRTEALRHGEDVVFRMARGEISRKAPTIVPGHRAAEDAPAAPPAPPPGGWDQPLTRAEFAGRRAETAGPDSPAYDGGSFLEARLARNRLADLGDTTWYFMFADADDLVHPETADKTKTTFRFSRDKLKTDKVTINMRQGTFGTVYGYVWLARVDPAKRFKWVGWLHEYVDADGWKPTTAKMHGGYIESRRDGARNRDPLKYLADALVLERYLLIHPKEPRTLFYLAQSYKDGGKKALAVDIYQQCAAVSRWHEEVYISWLHAAKLTLELEPEAFDKVQAFLASAMNARPPRLEAPTILVQLLARRGWNAAAFALARGVYAALPPSGPPHEDILFVDEAVHGWIFFDAVSRLAAHQGDRRLAKESGARALASRGLEDATRKEILERLAACG